MQIRKLIGKNSLYLSWLLSYVVILFVPLLISGVIYYFTVNIITNETNRANSALLTQLQQNIDSKLNEIEKISIQIAFNNRVNAAITVKGPFESSDRFNLYQLSEDLQLSQSSTDIVNFMYIYFKNNNYVIDNQTCLDATFYHQQKKQDIIIEDIKKWKEMMQKPYHKEYLIFENKNEHKKSIGFIQSLPILVNKSNYRATLVQMINESTLLQIVEKVQWVNKGIVAIIDNENRIITSTQPVDLAASVTYKDLNKDIFINFRRKVRCFLCFVQN